MASNKESVDQPSTAATIHGDEHSPILEPSQQTRLSKLIPISSIDFQSLGNLNESLKDSIEHIGLLNPITVAPNLSQDNEAKPYKLIAGRSRLKAYLALGRAEIPATLLEFEDTDTHEERRRRLATLEENVVRKNLPLIELCEQLGTCKDIYDELYGTGWGKASPNKDPETGSLPYVLKVAQDLKKSRSAVATYLKIYKDLIVPHKRLCSKLKNKKHPVLQSITELTKLSQQGSDIPDIIDYIFYQDDDNHKFRNLDQAVRTIKSRRAKEEKARQEQKEALKRQKELEEAKKGDEEEAQQKTADINNAESQSSSEVSSHDEAQGDNTNQDEVEEEEGFDYDTYLESIKSWNDNTYKEVIDKAGAYGINAFSLEVRLEYLKEFIESQVDIQEFSIGDYHIHTTHNSVVITFHGYTPPDEYRDKVEMACPGFGLYHPESEICSTCPAKLECVKAQMFAD